MTLCIVLDIDSTLVHTFQSMEKMDNIHPTAQERAYIIALDGTQDSSTFMWGVERPHLASFLQFLFDKCLLVAIWSAGKRDYVEAVVDKITRDTPAPHTVWTYDEITRTPQGFYKPLKKMWEDPMLSQFMNENNTLIIDDNEMTFSWNPRNAIHIPEYHPKLHGEDNDKALLEIMEWMNKGDVLHCNDVRSLKKPFE